MRLSLVYFMPLVLVEAWKQAGVRFKRLQSKPQGSAVPLATRANVKSVVACAKLCTNNFRCSCRGYGYQKACKDCLVFNSSLVDEASGGASMHLQYYAADYALGGIGSPCQSHKDCDCVPGLECDNSVCRCPTDHKYTAALNRCEQVKILSKLCPSNPNLGPLQGEYCQNGTCCPLGYHFNLGSHTCHETCANGYGDTYYMIRQDECMNGNNADQDFRALTLQQCWSWCKTDPQCRSFEHAADRCFKSYTTVLEQPCAWMKCPYYNNQAAFTYYQRNCA